MAIGLFTPAQIDSLAALSPNLVFLDSSPFESRFDSVVLGYELGISLALDHLTELGHTRIGFIGPVYKLDDRRQRALEVRRQLFERQAEQRGLLDLGLMLDCPMEAQAAARAVGEKSIAMLPQKELLPLTGYVHGGCSPVGMKKQFPTVFHETAELFDTICVSAGKIGAQVEVNPADLVALLGAKMADVTVN